MPKIKEEGETEDAANDGERLQKVLARIGFGSRRACELLISGGRVHVNDEIAQLGRRVHVETDRVEVDGELVAIRNDTVYYLLNKPAGVVTTASDPQKRSTVLSLVPAEPRVFSVGRLDMATEGLLLLTNDGEFTQLITHPSHGVEKEYLVELDKRPSDSAITRLRKGVQLDDQSTAPAQVGRVDERGLRIVIHEGRNRQVRKMCEEVGYRVKRLVRTRIGPLSDRRLKPGKWRELTTEEVRELMKAAQSLSHFE